MQPKFLFSLQTSDGLVGNRYTHSAHNRRGLNTILDGLRGDRRETEHGAVHRARAKGIRSEEAERPVHKCREHHLALVAEILVLVIVREQVRHGSHKNSDEYKQR